MQRFGYMNETSAASLISEKAFSEAIMEFQRFAGMNETGKFTLDLDLHLNFYVLFFNKILLFLNVNLIEIDLIDQSI